MDWYIGTEWKLEKKGLKKKVIDLKFTELEKPNKVSKVIIKVAKFGNLNDRPSLYLRADKIDNSQELTMGTAITPVDYYLEMLVQQMVLGEKAHCFMRTASHKNDDNEDSDLNFIITLEEIISFKEFHKLDVKEMYNLAVQYKECGVKMFKEYPKFAHDYFSRAAKCLITYQPFEPLTADADGVDGEEMKALLIQIQTNLAACLLMEERYEDVIYLTQFVESVADPSEKSIYRRAVAFYNIKEFAKAQELIEKVPNYKEKKEFVKLQQNVKQSWTVSNNQYKDILKRMFK
ncbi:peptidyl-prolyl cis-trans isomerase FKBP5 [Teleopsis dalmanni]|uniref:peptidyl-prolyl cis-trans isomerase FKBP5 n=1 Tax=Teleopsis dalmanni TaxID=139649 RepID=UPI0018CD57B9|nr:peptidyl-prolyl cis-trans isomerase FKBP5 [Teleopsis dalmanni]